MVEIAERLGHENISVTSTYSHLYPSKQKVWQRKLMRSIVKMLQSRRSSHRENIQKRFSTKK